MELSWYTLLRRQFQGYPDWAVDLGIFGIVFLIIGFLAKTFGRLFALALLGLLIFVAAAHYFNFAPMFLAELKTFFGVADVQLLGDIPMMFMDWARAHIFACLGGVLGFVVGYKLG